MKLHSFHKSGAKICRPQDIPILTGTSKNGSPALLKAQVSTRICDWVHEIFQEDTSESENSKVQVLDKVKDLGFRLRV